MTRRYSHVSINTATSYAEQRDSIDADELPAARAKDACEPAADKAWRGILVGHRHIRDHVDTIRRALHDLGQPMSACGKTYIQACYRTGFRWHDPKPERTLLVAQKALLLAIADMPRRWAILRTAEAGEPAKIPPPLPQSSGEDETQPDLQSNTIQTKGQPK